jgi:hypothetical protein
MDDIIMKNEMIVVKVKKMEKITNVVVEDTVEVSIAYGVLLFSSSKKSNQKNLGLTCVAQRCVSQN